MQYSIQLDITLILFSFRRSKAYPYLLLRAQILPSSSPNAEAALTEVIVDGLRLSSVFNFEPILSLPNITMVHSHCLFKLLRVFLGQGLAEYQTWLSQHGGELSTYSEQHSIICIILY
jgi:translation initiation factor 3 subunit M